MAFNKNIAVNTIGMGGWQWLLIKNIARKLEIL